jgi:hypothetical protein
MPEVDDTRPENSDRRNQLVERMIESHVQATSELAAANDRLASLERTILPIAIAHERENNRKLAWARAAEAAAKAADTLVTALADGVKTWPGSVIAFSLAAWGLGVITGQGPDLFIEGAKTLLKLKP